MAGRQQLQGVRGVQLGHNTSPTSRLHLLEGGGSQQHEWAGALPGDPPSRGLPLEALTSICVSCMLVNIFIIRKEFIND